MWQYERRNNLNLIIRLDCSSMWFVVYRIKRVSFKFTKRFFTTCLYFSACFVDICTVESGTGRMIFGARQLIAKKANNTKYESHFDLVTLDTFAIAIWHWNKMRNGYSTYAINCYLGKRIKEKGKVRILRNLLFLEVKEIIYYRLFCLELVALSIEECAISSSFGWSCT